MNDQELEILARAAGLDVVLQTFKDDLKAAARQAGQLRQTLGSAPAPIDEPWPPMRVSSPE